MKYIMVTALALTPLLAMDMRAPKAAARLLGLLNKYSARREVSQAER